MNLLEKMAPEERAGTGIHEAMTVPPVPSTEDLAADHVVRVLAASM